MPPRVLQQQLLFSISVEGAEPTSVCRSLSADPVLMARLQQRTDLLAAPISPSNVQKMLDAALKAFMEPLGRVRCFESGSIKLLRLVSELELGPHACWFAGKLVKACYGTTKYCNAFLKGLPCNNAECLYLHDVGEFQPTPEIYAVNWREQRWQWVSS